VTSTISEQAITTVITGDEGISTHIIGSNAITTVISSVGSEGPQGEPGQSGGTGLPPGGLTHQMLRKYGNGDYQVEWGNNYPYGLNGEVQFNDGGVGGADAELLYDKIAKALSVGRPEILPDNPLGLGGNVDSYLQANIRNKNAGLSSSADYIITADDGSDVDFYSDFGMCGSSYAVSEWDVVTGHDGYLWVDGGNMSIGTLTPGKKVHFFVANTSHEAHPADIIAEISSSGFNVIHGLKVMENNFPIRDMIVTVSGLAAENAAFAAGSMIVIRSDLI
jgi:hypothetical protein